MPLTVTRFIYYLALTTIKIQIINHTVEDHFLLFGDDDDDKYGFVVSNLSHVVLCICNLHRKGVLGKILTGLRILFISDRFALNCLDTGDSPTKTFVLQERTAVLTLENLFFDRLALEERERIQPEDINMTVCLIDKELTMLGHRRYTIGFVRCCRCTPGLTDKRVTADRA